MKKEQIKKNLKQMKDYLKAMKEDRLEFSAFHDEDSDIMLDLDLDILIALQAVKELTNQLQNR